MVRACARNPGARLAAAGLAAVVLLTILASCATGPTRRTTFVGRADGVRERTAKAEGLNPLASLDTCLPGEAQPEAPTRVLISAPRYFSRDATDMVQALQEALATGVQTQDVEIWLATGQLRDAPQAKSEGERCGAMVVLWEPHGTNTLEMTLSNTALVPLREQVRERLCPFGSQGQQANTLYLTIVGLTAMMDNRYDDAVYYVDAANRLDRKCLSLPGVSPSPQADAGGDGTDDAAATRSLTDAE